MFDTAKIRATAMISALPSAAAALLEPAMLSMAQVARATGGGNSPRRGSPRRFTSPGRGRGGGGGRGGAGTCWTCGGAGHKAADCKGSPNGSRGGAASNGTKQH